MIKNFGKILYAPWGAKDISYAPYQLWYLPLKKIFNEMITFDPQEILNKFGHEQLNKKFLAVVIKEKPEYIFFDHRLDIFDISTLLKAKEICPNVKMIDYCGDDDTEFFNYSIYNMLLIDYFLLTHKKFKPYYGKRGFMSLSIDTESFKPMNLSKKYDVSYVGTCKVDRPDFIRFLLKRGINVKVFGKGWDSYPEFNSVYGGNPNNEEYKKIINQTKINLVFSKNSIYGTHLKQRPFEIGACGAFPLTEHCGEYKDYFIEGKDFISFQNKKGLLKKIEYYLKHEKERGVISKRLYTKITKNFSNKKELKKIISSIAKMGPVNLKREVFNSNPKVVYLSRDNLNRNKSSLNKKLADFDYICFKNNAKNNPYREQLQAYAIKKLKKPISCCDCYVYHPKLGNYLYFISNLALNTLSSQEFAKVFDISQLMVQRDFFIKNLEIFKQIFDKKISGFINEKNTSFVSFPLINVTKINELSYKKMDAILLKKFENQLNALAYKKRLFLNSYAYYLILHSVFNNHFILKYLIEKIHKMFSKSLKF